MRFREHRNSLADSMETLREFDTTEQLVSHITSLLHSWLLDVTREKLSCSLLSDRPDTRIDWPETWLVSLDGYGVVGMTDQKPELRERRSLGV